MSDRPQEGDFCFISDYKNSSDPRYYIIESINDLFSPEPSYLRDKTGDNVENTNTMKPDTERRDNNSEIYDSHVKVVLLKRIYNNEKINEYTQTLILLFSPDPENSEILKCYSNFSPDEKNIMFLKEVSQVPLRNRTGSEINEDVSQISLKPTLTSSQKTYIIRSGYYGSEIVDPIFKKRGWIKYPGISSNEKDVLAGDDKIPTLLYEDGENMYEKTTYMGKSVVKGILADSKKAITDKNMLYQSMTKYFPDNQHMMKQYSIKPSSKNTQQIKRGRGRADYRGRGDSYSSKESERFSHIPREIFDGSKPWILKWVHGHKGKDITIVRSYDELVSSPNPEREYVLAEYINEPLLYDGYKFHIRVNVIYGTDSGFIIMKKLNNARLAVKKYRQESSSEKDYYNDKEIHDTHFTTKDKMKMPEDLEKEFGTEIMGIINEQIDEIVEMTLTTFEPESYPESESAFEIFGYDFMVDKDYKVYLLEANRKVALNNYDPEILFDYIIIKTEELLDSP